MSRSAAPTDCLFREDSYLKECAALVVGLTEAGGIVLDRTVFYAASGGQPADRGMLTTATGDAIPIVNASYTDPEKTEIAHVPAATTGVQFKIGEPVRLKNRVYRVVARLPETGSQEPRYRIRNEEIADDERIVMERDLRNHAPS